MISGWRPNTSTLSLFQAGDLLTDGGTPAALWGPLGMPPTLPNAVQGVPKHQKNSQRNCSEVECSHLYFFFNPFCLTWEVFLPQEQLLTPRGSQHQQGAIRIHPCLQEPGPQALGNGTLPWAEARAPVLLGAAFQIGRLQIVQFT